MEIVVELTQGNKKQNYAILISQRAPVRFDRRYDLLIIVTTAQVAKSNNSLACWRTKQLHCLCLIAINLFGRVEKRKMRCKHRRIYLNNALPISPPCSFHFPQLFSILLIFLLSRFLLLPRLAASRYREMLEQSQPRLLRSSNSTSHFFLSSQTATLQQQQHWHARSDFEWNTRHFIVSKNVVQKKESRGELFSARADHIGQTRVREPHLALAYLSLHSRCCSYLRCHVLLHINLSFKVT